MNKSKTILANRHIICKTLVLLGLVLLVFSCKKLDKDNPIAFTIKAHIPYSEEPISGVKYTIREYRSKKFSTKMGDTEYTDFELSGQTDQNGNALISFLPKKNLDYQYEIYFDYSSLQFQSFTGSFTLIHPPSFDRVERSYQENYDIRALPLMQVQLNFKNLSCVNSADQFKYKQYNLDELPNYTFNNAEPWIEGSILNGCVDLTGNYHQRLSGRYVYKWEAIRGGNITTGVDTFFVSPSGSDKINMFW